MIKSMTGFGKHSEELPNHKISFEIKSLNSKQLDLILKVPPLFKDKELELRAILSPVLQRGKAEGVLAFESDKKLNSTLINKPVLDQYLSEMKSISKEHQLGQTDLLSVVMKIPDVLVSEISNCDEEAWKNAMKVILKAIEKFNKFRLCEGQALEDDFKARIAQIQTLLNAITPHEKQRITKIRETLKTNLEKIVDVATIDYNRFEQELFYYLEKLDITEEKVRLEKHCTYFLDTLNEESTGKKLNFITQEIGREINTIGSKANDVSIQKIVVEMKDELEKIKEQLGNIL